MAQPNVEDVVKAIAADTNTPAETVSKMYADTWAEYSEGARNNGLPGSSRRKTRSQKICAACLNRGTETAVAEELSSSPQDPPFRYCPLGVLEPGNAFLPFLPLTRPV
jgi:hypothetical protein